MCHLLEVCRCVCERLPVCLEKEAEVQGIFISTIDLLQPPSLQTLGCSRLDLQCVTSTLGACCRTTSLSPVQVSHLCARTSYAPHPPVGKRKKHKLCQSLRCKESQQESGTYMHTHTRTRTDRHKEWGSRHIRFPLSLLSAPSQAGEVWTPPEPAERCERVGPHVCVHQTVSVCGVLCVCLCVCECLCGGGGEALGSSRALYWCPLPPPPPSSHPPLETQLCGIVCQWDKGMAPSVLLYGPVTRINYKPIESAAANWWTNW